MAFAGQEVARTRYRPDPWAAPEWLVAFSGIASAVALIQASATGLAALDPTFVPLTWPVLPLGPVLAILLALAPAVLAPPLPRARIIAPRGRTEPPPPVDAVVDLEPRTPLQVQR